MKEKLVEYISTRVTRDERKRMEAVAMLTGRKPADLLREALNAVLDQYLKEQPGQA